jgi:hypothetical protein
MASRKTNQHWNLRAGDSERELVIDQLREHTAAGRLSLEEFESRLEETYNARTYRELAWVTRELPRLEPRPRFAHLNVGRHVALTGGAAVVWVGALGAAWWEPLPLATAAISAAYLTFRHRMHLRRNKRLGARRQAWQIAASDRWRHNAAPPPQTMSNRIWGGAQQWDWSRQGGGQYPGHRTTRSGGGWY